MIVQDFLRKANIERQVEIICRNQPDYEPPYDRNIVRVAQKKFIDMLLNLTPKSDASVIVFERQWDDWDDKIEERVSAELYEIEDIKRYLHENRDETNFDVDEAMDTEDMKALMKRERKDMPQGYGYEFSEWEDILGWQICEENLDEFDIQECIYAILYEMSFNGMTREHQQERRQELDESIREAKELEKLPEEEREKHYISYEAMKEHWKEKFGWEEPSEEEQIRRERLMYTCMMKNTEYRKNNFNRIRNSEIFR